MNEPITSRNNPRIKLVSKLRDRNGRREQQRIIIDGVREIRRAFDAGVKFEEAFICESNLKDESQPLLQQLVAKSCEVVQVNPYVLEKIAFGDRSDGMVAVARMPKTQLHQLAVRDDMLVAVLENVEKPGNVGAVLRSADAAGVAAVIVADGGTDLYNPNSIRASAGTIFSMPLVACSGDEALAWLRQHAFQIFATHVNGAVDYTSVDYAGRSAVVLGSESQGLSGVWRGDDITSIRLPLCGVGDSLNVSVTAAVLFYESLRQREN